MMDVLIILVVFLVYWIPFAVAVGRDKRDQTAIFILNLVAGWTFIGWVVALVWACVDD